MNALLPMFILMLWTFVIGIMTGLVRRTSLMNQEVKIKDIALNSNNFPEKILKYGNNFNNLFQVPLIFYALMITATVIKYTPTYIIIFAWLFVALRLAHSIVHITNNNVTRRFSLFIASNICLMVITIALLIQVWSLS